MPSRGFLINKQSLSLNEIEMYTTLINSGNKHNQEQKLGKKSGSNYGSTSANKQEHY